MHNNFYFKSYKWKITVLLLVICLLHLSSCILEKKQVSKGKVELLHGITRLGDKTWYPRFTFFPGKPGISTGGGIRISLPEILIDPATISRACENKIISVYSSAKNVALETVEKKEGKDWALQVTVKEGQIEPDENLIINFDRSINAKNSGKYKYKLAYRHNSKSNFNDVEEIPEIEVKPNLVIRSPRLITVGIPFDISVIVQLGPDVGAYTGSMVFNSTDKKATLPGVYQFKSFEKGTHTFQKGFRFQTEGYHTIEAADQLGQLQGSVTLACRSVQIPYKLYFGEMHEHTSLSDGRGLAEDYFKAARDKEHLDFVMLTDHDYHLSDSKWEYVKSLVRKYHDPGNFVTFSAYEYSSKLGDKNIYFLDEDAPIFRRNETRSDHPLKLFDRLKGLRAIVVPHHSPCAFRPTDWDIHDPDIQRLVEIYSLHGRTEYYSCSNPVTPRTPLKQKFTTEYSVINVRDKSVQDALKRGYRLGIVCGGDSHSGMPATLGLAGIYAKNLTRDDIFDALYERRCYGTTNARIILDFTLNGHMMGEEIISSAPPKIEVLVIGTSPLDKIEVIKNNKVIYTHQCSKDIEHFEFMDQEPIGATSYYYVRVTQRDYEMAWSSPVWVDYPASDLLVTGEEMKFTDTGAGIIKIDGFIKNQGIENVRSCQLLFKDKTPDGKVNFQKNFTLNNVPSKGSLNFSVLSPSGAVQGRHTFELIVDPLDQIKESVESNNSLDTTYLVTSATIIEDKVVAEAPAGENKKWKEYKFKTRDEDVRIDIVAEAEFSGVKGMDPKIYDDNLRISLDGVNYDWKRPFGWDGVYDMGKTRQVTFMKSMLSGHHVLELYSDETPVLKSLRISGTGFLPEKVQKLKRSFENPEMVSVNSDSVTWLNFVYEDGVSIFRYKLDDSHVLLGIVWSKDYENTDPYTEDLRWYRGELQFVNCSYTYNPWKFREITDYIVDDAKGWISLVTRADKPCGIECIVNVSPDKASYAVIDFFNGGERIPEKTWFGRNLINSYPVRIPLNIKKSDEDKESEPEYPHIANIVEEKQSRDSENMKFLELVNAGNFRSKLDELYKLYNKPEKMRNVLDQAIKKMPENPRLHYSMGNLELKLNNYEKAQDEYRLALKLGLDSYYLHRKLGESLEALKNHQKAALEYQTAIKMNPEYIAGYLSLGKFYLTQEKTKMALETLSQAYSLQSFNPEVKYYLAEAFFKTGNRKNAVKVWKECVEINPDGKFGRRAKQRLQEES